MNQFRRLNQLFRCLNLGIEIFPEQYSDVWIWRFRRLNLGFRAFPEPRPKMAKRISEAIRTSKWRLRIYAKRQPSLNGSSIRLKYQCPNIHKRIFIDFDFKTPKIGIYTKSIQTKINCTRISVRNSYLTIEDNYRQRCEIKNLTFEPKRLKKKLESKGESTTLQIQLKKLDSKL